MVKCYNCGVEIQDIGENFICTCGSKNIVDSDFKVIKNGNTIDCSCEAPALSFVRSKVGENRSINVYKCSKCSNLITIICYK